MIGFGCQILKRLFTILIHTIGRSCTSKREQAPETSDFATRELDVQHATLESSKEFRPYLDDRLLLLQEHTKSIATTPHQSLECDLAVLHSEP